MRGRMARRLTSPAAALVGTALVTVLVAVCANLSLELWSTDGDAKHLGQVLTQGLPLFLLGSFVVWLFVVLLVAVLGRLWLSVGIVFVVTGILGFADQRKEQILTEPLYPSDLVFRPGVGFLSQMVGAGVLVTALLLSLVVLAAAVLLGRWLGGRFRRLDRRTRPVQWWLLVAGRVVVAAAVVMALFQVLQFHSPGNSLRSAYDRFGAHWRPWDQALNYHDNGVVAGLLYNLPMNAMPRPRGYSEAAMRRIVARYTAEAEAVNRSRDPNALHDVDVVSVLSEAFSDPTRFHKVKLAEDPIPYTRQLMTRVPSGRMFSPMYGGGTANVEFSVLTGMSESQFRPQMTTPYQMLVPSYRSFPSVLRYFEGEGMSTMALHSFTSALYRRAEVYPILGFDHVAFEDDMTHREKVDKGRYISDEATFEEALSRLRASRGPTFMNVVTMQNHFPQGGQYHDPIPVTGMKNPEDRANLEGYARGLVYSDHALEKFLAALRAGGRKTVVLFYGDHTPAVWHHTGMPPLMRHETPFFVWKSFGTQKPQQLPTTSPIYFMNHVLEAADAPVSPYYALLGRLEQQVPAMTPGYFLTANRTKLPWELLGEEGSRVLHDYRLVLYDLTVGRHYSEKAMFEVPGHATEEQPDRMTAEARGGPRRPDSPAPGRSPAPAS